MSFRNGRGKFSFSLLFVSFFGALMVAATFAYYNHKFQQYKFFDFEKIILYNDQEIFVPEHERYGVLIYSSKMKNFDQVIKKLNTNVPIIAIDIFLEKRGVEEGITFLTAGTNTILQIIHRFAVREVPSFFLIKRKNDRGLYKQDSHIYSL